MKKGPSRAKESAVMKGLKQALRNEIDGAEFYRMAAGSARRDAVRQMFQFLMEEEERHRAAIVNQMQRLAEGKGMKFERAASAKKALAKFKSPLLTDDLVKEGRQVEGEVAALSIGMTLEKRAIAQFTRPAENGGRRRPGGKGLLRPRRMGAGPPGRPDAALRPVAGDVLGRGALLAVLGAEGRISEDGCGPTRS